jgi:hypothetical protein
MSSVEANDRGGRDAGMGLEQQVPIVDTWAGQPISLRSCRMFAASTVDRGFSVRRCSFSRRFENSLGWAPSLDGPASLAGMSLFRKLLDWFERTTL